LRRGIGREGGSKPKTEPRSKEEGKTLEAVYRSRSE
jgi:hypothetical protein